jgi:nucleotide-binding universal stress UspA family protein
VNESLEAVKHRPSFGGDTLPGPDSLEEWRNAYAQTAERELSRLAQQHCQGVQVESVLLEGYARISILDYLKSHPCELIVMGTHGRPWYQHFLIGSTAETLLRASWLPILIVRNAVATSVPPRLHTLLLPTDFSVSGMASEDWALHLAAAAEKEVLLFHAVENPLLEVYEPDKAEIDLRRLMEESREHPPRSAQPFWENAQRVAQAKLSLMRQQFAGKHAQVELLVREGPAAEDVLQVATERNADLIIMATHGRSGVRRLLLGSVTEKVIHAAPCPVLAVRSEG